MYTSVVGAVKWRLRLISDLGAVRDQTDAYKRFAVIEYVHDEACFAYFARFNGNKASSYICQLQQQGLFKLYLLGDWIWLFFIVIYIDLQLTRTKLNIKTSVGSFIGPILWSRLPCNLVNGVQLMHLMFQVTVIVMHHEQLNIVRHAINSQTLGAMNEWNTWVKDTIMHELMTLVLFSLYIQNA